ncbi:hypothetical protein [Nonomuraea candida]|uniref:hypothetical protein n=1 Tax=Nonomuraea candida TaxID=359159 RepID=UPI000A8C5AC5|nr:hypothetical protein [Nonomuraea candida]
MVLNAFGRTFQRLHVTQARVGQAIRKQERRVGQAIKRQERRIGATLSDRDNRDGESDLLHALRHDQNSHLPVARAHRQSGAGPTADPPAMEADARPSTIAALVAGLLAGYGIAIPVGAVATYLVALTARTSLKTGAFAALGVATADGMYALIAALGGAALTPFIQPIVAPLRRGAGLVLIISALRAGVTAIRRHRQRHQPVTMGAMQLTPGRAYWTLLGDHDAQPSHRDLFRGTGARHPGIGHPTRG